MGLITRHCFAGSLAILAGICTIPTHAQDLPGPVPLNEYERTLNALEQYRQYAAEDDGSALPDPGEPVDRGDPYEGVPRLVHLLTLLGDLPPSTPAPNDDVYDGAVVIGVQRFQNRHGLEPSGRIDAKTLAELNTPLSSRVRQLELTLERWRRHPYDPSRPVIILNVPEFRLRAYRDNHLELEMKIVVGQAPERKTPLLSSELAAIIFRPYWNVPLRIQRDELVPEIVKDPSYLSSHNLEMVNTEGIVLHASISRDTLAQLRAGQLRLRQTPGPENALGLAKFVFPNDYDVYMHDTPVQSVFYRSRRDLSHGCVRLEKAEDLAEWVLQNEPGWSRERIEDAMKGSESVSVKLDQGIQVVTMYATAVVLDSGEVHFFDDIYGEDQALEKKLSAVKAHALDKSGKPFASHFSTLKH